MHPSQFLIDRDVAKDSDVAIPRTLDVGVLDGHQVFPPGQNGSPGANRLLIFTGTVLLDKSGDSDDVSRGVLRVRLRFPLSRTVNFVGSASVAALATGSGNDANILLGADQAVTVPDPTDGGTVPPSGLPANELYLIVDVAIASQDATIQRIAYQANVLIQDTTPDLDSLLVRAYPTDQFSDYAHVQPGDDWEFQITLTGPALDPGGFTVLMGSDSERDVPVQRSVALTPGQSSAVFRAPATADHADTVAVAAITAVGTRTTKTATVAVSAPR
jgi:hypothetical protein